MAEIQTSSWSETAASNNGTPPDGFPEGMAYSAVNDGIREQMAAIKRAWNRDHATVNSGGTGTAYTLALSVSPPAWVNGLRFGWRANVDCGASPTLAPGSLAAKPLSKPTATGTNALSANDIRAGQLVFCSYDTITDSLMVENVIAAHVPVYPPYMLADAIVLSGSTVQITGIPATAKAVDIVLTGVGTDGTVAPMIQIGPSSGVVATAAYTGALASLSQAVGTVQSSNYSTGFTLSAWALGANGHGVMRLTRLGASVIWNETHTFSRHDAETGVVSTGAGHITLGGALERVRIATSDTITAGWISVFYS